MNIFSLVGSIMVDSSEADKSLQRTDKNVEGVGNKFLKGIGTAAKWGAGLALAAGTAALAVIGLSVNVGEDLQKALNGLQSETGTTDKAMISMRDSMLAIYNNNFGESFEDIGKAMATVSQATGLTGEELEKATQNALMLRDTFEMDVDGSIVAVDQLMKQFGLTSEESYNLLAQGAQKGMNSQGDLVDIIKEYSGQFKTMGFSAEEMFNMLSNGAKEGGFSIDVMGDAMKEFNIRSKDGSKASAEAFESLGLNADKLTKSFGKGGAEGKKAFSDVIEKLKGMKDPVEQNQAGVALFGTMWEDLGAKAILAMGDTKGGIESAKDALARINAGKYNTFGEAMQGIKRNLTTGILLPLGDLVLPALKKFSTWITDNMPAIKNKIETVMSGVGTAFNIAIKVISNIVKGFIKFKVALIPIMAVVMAVIVNAWVVTTAKAVASAITQGIQSVKVMKAWIKTGVTATIHAIKQVAAWVMVGLGAIKSALITVAQSAIVVAKWIWMGVQALLHAAKQVAAWVLTGVGAIAAGVIMVAQAALMVAKWAFMGAQALIHAAKMAAAWIIALGPIGWAMIAIAALGIFIATHWEQVKAVTVKVFTAIGTFLSGVWDGIKKVFSVVGRVISGFFTEAWTKIKVVWSAVGGFFSGVWNGIKSVFSGIGSWFRNIFQGAWTAIKNVFNGVGSFFSGIWNTIKSKFTSIGSSIGSAIGGAFKTVVNSIIRFAQNTINGFIRAINGAIGLINKIPGVEIGRVSTLSIPRLAKGGVVDSGQIYQAGEDGREVIMPLEKNTGWIDQLASKINISGKGNTTNYNAPLVQVTNMTVSDKNDVMAISNELYNLQRNAERSWGR